jgi:hypothetical protein
MASHPTRILIPLSEWQIMQVNFLSNSMEQIPWESDISSSSREMSCILWTWDVHYCVHISLPLVPAMRQKMQSTASSPFFINLDFITFKYNQQDATFTMVFITINALRVWGGSSAHHQELKTLYMASGFLSSFFCSLPLLWASCSHSLTIAVRSRKS